MNDIEYFQRLGADLPGPSDDVRNHARIQLVAAAQRETAQVKESARVVPPARSRRSFLRLSPLRVLAGVTAAGLIAVGVQAAQVTAPDGRGVAPASAAELLNRAGDRVANRPLVAGPGQYKKVTTTLTGHTFTENENGPVLGADGTDLTYATARTDELWFPSDRTRDVIHRVSPKKLVAFAPADEKIVRRKFRDDSEVAGVFSSPNPNSPATKPREDGTAPSFADFSDEKMAALPRDPEELLDYIHDETKSSPHSQEWAAFDYISTVLRNNLAPADLQAAMFKAAALIPGVEVVERTVTLDGRTGVAVASNAEEGARDELIFDPETGEVIGERESSTDPAFHSLLGGSVSSWTSVRTEIVDSAPKVSKR